MRTAPVCICEIYSWLRPSFFVVAPSDRLSPPLDIQLETINCTAFSVRWKMPRRHVSTITGYKVVHFSFICSIFFFKISKPLERSIIWSNFWTSVGKKKTLLLTCLQLRLCFPPKWLNRIRTRPNPQLKESKHTATHSFHEPSLLTHRKVFNLTHRCVLY